MDINEEGLCEQCRRAEMRGKSLFCTRYIDLCENVRFTCEEDAFIEDEVALDLYDDDTEW
jgi:hypothetical protein